MAPVLVPNRSASAVDLVEETGEGHGKQRFWAAAQDSHGWRNTKYKGDPDAQAAAAWLRQQQVRYLTGRAEEWEQERERWPEAWQDSATMSDAILELSADQLDELMEELYAVVLRYRELPPAKGSQQVVVHLVGMPAEPRDVP